MYAVQQGYSVALLGPCNTHLPAVVRMLYASAIKLHWDMWRNSCWNKVVTVSKYVSRSSSLTLSCKLAWSGSTAKCLTQKPEVQYRSYIKQKTLTMLRYRCYSVQRSVSRSQALSA